MIPRSELPIGASGVAGAPTVVAVSQAIILAIISRPQGLHGEVRVKPFTAELEYFQTYRNFYIAPLPAVAGAAVVLLTSSTQLCTVEYFKPVAKQLAIKLVGVDSLSAADALRGHCLCKTRAELAPLSPAVGEHEITLLIAELMGAEVYVVLTSQRMILGHFTAYYEGGSNGLVELSLNAQAQKLFMAERKPQTSLLVPCGAHFIGKVTRHSVTQQVTAVELKALAELVDLRHCEVPSSV